MLHDLEIDFIPASICLSHSFSSLYSISVYVYYLMIELYEEQCKILNIIRTYARNDDVKLSEVY